MFLKQKKIFYIVLISTKLEYYYTVLLAKNVWVRRGLCVCIVTRYGSALPAPYTRTRNVTRIVCTLPGI